MYDFVHLRLKLFRPMSHFFCSILCRWATSHALLWFWAATECEMFHSHLLSFQLWIVDFKKQSRLQSWSKKSQKCVCQHSKQCHKLNNCLPTNNINISTNNNDNHCITISNMQHDSKKYSLVQLLQCLYHFCYICDNSFMSNNICTYRQKEETNKNNNKQCVASLV